MAAHVVPLNSQSTAVWITLANFITVWITLAGLLMAWITLAGLLSVDYISRLYHNVEYFSRPSQSRSKNDCHWVPVSIVYEICTFI